MVETVNKGDGVTLYEASFTSKAGKKGEVLVKADGTEAKDQFPTRSAPGSGPTS
jgi:hypothetical protein